MASGAVVTESVFAWPGVGRLTLEAIAKRDFPLIQGIVLFMAAVFILVNLAVDCLYAAQVLASGTTRLDYARLLRLVRPGTPS